jgi:hypothetical protein
VYASQDIIRVIKEDQMLGECGTHGKDKKRIQNFGLKTRREERTLKT